MKTRLERMSAHERSEVESFLRVRRLAERPGFREKVAAAQSRMDKGEAVTPAEMRSLLGSSPPAAE